MRYRRPLAVTSSMMLPLVSHGAGLLACLRLCVRSRVLPCLLLGSLTGCLQEKDLSADALTSFEGSGGAGAHQDMPAGAAANAAINGEAPTGGGSTEGSPAPHLHEEKPAGFGSTSAPDTGTTAAEGTPKPHHHEEKPAGFGATASTDTGTTAAEGTPKPHTHEEKPAGFGATALPSEPKPEAHEHKEMPPGYGSNQPSAPSPEKVASTGSIQHKEKPPGFGSTSSAAPTGTGTGTGSAEAAFRKVSGETITPFERDYKGKKLITLSGTLTYDGAIPQNLDLDCFAIDKSAPGGRKLVNKAKLVEAGPYSIKVPAQYGQLAITAFVDLSNNGPDSKDPQGVYAKNPIEIKDKDIKGIDIVLKVPGKTP
ncbi:MAG: hypothetical protein ACKO6N_27745 [Myxococcota bacterium]